MKKVLIVEDNKANREYLRKIITSIDSNIKVIEASNCRSGLEIANGNDVDLFFIDVELPDFSGIEFAKVIRKNEKYILTMMVFTTGHIDFMLQAFKSTHCYDYLIKPFSKDSIVQIINTLSITDRASKSKKELEKLSLLIESKGVIFRILIEDIFFIEVRLRTCIIHTKKEKLIFNNMSLKKIQDKLSNETLVQCHRSYLVNLRYIEKLYYKNGSCIAEFENYNQHVMIGKKFKGIIEERLSQLY